jgi:hypothetical protein
VPLGTQFVESFSPVAYLTARFSGIYRLFYQYCIPKGILGEYTDIHNKKYKPNIKGRRIKAQPIKQPSKKIRF